MPATTGPKPPATRPSKGQHRRGTSPDEVPLEREIMGRLRKIRESKEIGQELYGRMLGGMSKAQVSLFENSRNHPRVDQIQEMAKALGYHFHWAVREGVSDPLNELERHALRLAPHQLGLLLRLARVLPHVRERVLETLVEAWEAQYLPAAERNDEGTTEKKIS